MEIATGEGPTTAVNLGIGVFNLDNVIPFGGQATLIDLARFSARADAFACP